jgi:hypothetical protein
LEGDQFAILSIVEQHLSRHAVVIEVTQARVHVVVPAGREVRLEDRPIWAHGFAPEGDPLLPRPGSSLSVAQGHYVGVEFG